MFDPIDITLTDPRGFDGNPYEVAERAVAQVEGALLALAPVLSAAQLMARNAEMERNIALGLPPAGSAYDAGPQGRRFTEVADAFAASLGTLGTLRQAVAFDPKHPPRA